MAPLTELFLRNVKPPATGQKEYHDSQVRGLSCRVSQGGTKSFSLVYGNPRKRVSLGKFPYVSIKQAREKASKLIAHRMLHGDTQPDLTLEETITLYLKLHSKEHHRPSTQKITEYWLTRHWLHLGSKALKDITTADVLRVTDNLIRTPRERNNAHATLRGLMRWAVRRRYISHSPLEGLYTPARTTPRSRTLNPHELHIAFTYGANMGLYGQLIRILLISAQRVGQFKCLRPEWIKDDRIEWPAEYMKGNRPHFIPLTPLLKQELENFPTPFHFGNWTHAHRRWLRDTGLAHHTRHDLRRSAITHMANHTVPHVLERICAHQRTISGVTQIYNRHEYFSEMRDALLRHDRWLTTL